MCKHVLNAQVSVRAACCRAWYDCPQCHQEATVLDPHPILKTNDVTLACKSCKRVFRRDTRKMAEEPDEADEFCPFCDNRFVIDAVTI